MADLFYNALYRTLKDYRKLAVYKLQKISAMHCSFKPNEGMPIKKKTPLKEKTLTFE